MKTVRRLEEESLFDRYGGIPDDVWLEILGWCRLEDKYRHATVCKAWGHRGGLVDQSVTVLLEYDHLVVRRLASMVNLQRLWCKAAETFTVLIGLHLKHLTSLNISGLCGSCTQLQTLLANTQTLLPKLVHLQFTPRHPDNLAHLNTIQRLTLVSGNLRTYCHVDSLKCLTRLGLFQTKVNVPFFRSLSSLRCLKLQGGEDVRGLSYLTSLTSLTLSSNLPLACHMFDPLTNLTHLDAYHCYSLTADMILRLPALKSLSFILTKETPYQFMSDFLTNLTRLIINKEGHSISSHDNTLGRLTNLKSLEVPAIKDIFHIAPLTSLTELSVHHVRSSAFCALLNHRCLTRLTLTGSYDVDPLAFNDLPLSLCELDLSDLKSFQPNMYHLLTRLTNLRRLTLRKCRASKNYPFGDLQVISKVSYLV